MLNFHLTDNYFNAVSFDIEEWYHANYEDVSFDKFQKSSTNLEDNVDRLIDICAKHNIKSTCFVLGSVAKNKPYLVKKLHEAGHEIASHGFSHKLVYNMTEYEFSDDLKLSKNILEAIIGENVNGFRAPSWSVNREILHWYYCILEENEFIYSSSVYPAYTYLYGIPGFNRYAHYPQVNGKTTNILEIPVPVFGAYDKYIGYSGGFYLRFFPAWLITWLIRMSNRKNISTFIYVHPREIDVNQKRLKLDMLENFIHYFGISSCEKKLDNIIGSIAESCLPIVEGIAYLNKSKIEE